MEDVSVAEIIVYAKLLIYRLVEVVWHTGKVLACSAVGPRFKPRQDPGDFVGPIPFCIRMAHYSSGEAGWFSARTLSFHQCS